VTPLLLDIVVKATAVLAAAAAVDARLRGRGSAAARHLVWSIAMAALLVLPVASSALPHWALRIPVARTVALVSPDVTVRGSANAVGRSAAEGQDAPAPVSIEPAVSTRRPLEIALVALPLLYLAGVILLLARLALEPFALRRLTHASIDLADPAWQTRLEAAQETLRVTERVRLLQSPRDVMPLTFGTMAPTIVLPASADEWTDDRRNAVLLHELAHIARRDCFIQRLTSLTCAIYWPHPGVWYAARRLRVERELACDDRVLAAGAGPREYAGHLLELAHSLGSAPAPATALGMARARQLESRLLAVLDAARNRATLGPRTRAVALAIGIAVLIPLAAVRAAVVSRDIPVTTAAAAPKTPAIAIQSPDLAGTWEARVSRDPGMIQITVRTEHGAHGRTVRIDQLQGVTADQISAPNSTVRFPIRREAGTFNVDGVCRRGVCAGTYTFEPDQAFAAALAQRGLARPTPRQQMDLALADVGIAFLDELARNGYAKPDLPDMIRAAQHGVGAEYVREMAALGYRVGTLDALIRLRDHGIDPTYARAMSDLGFARLTVDEILTARDHGIDPEYVKGLRDLGYRVETLDALVQLRDHGIDPNYVRGMTEIGFPRLTVDQLLTARNHGVDPEYVKGMRDLGYRVEALDALVRLRDHGIDPSYVRGMTEAGYPKLTVDQLLTARNHGVDPAFVLGMAEAGYKGLALNDLVRMRDHGVDAAYVRRVQQRGLGHLSVDELIERRDRGMDDPDAAARAVVSQIQSLWHSVVTWLRS